MTASQSSLNELPLGTCDIEVQIGELVLPLISWEIPWFGLRGRRLVTVMRDLLERQQGGYGEPRKNSSLPNDVHALFSGTNYAHIATRLPDGSPHSVPIWVGVEGDRIAFLTSPESRKARNLEHDPRVSVSTTDTD